MDFEEILQLVLSLGLAGFAFVVGIVMFVGTLATLGFGAFCGWRLFTKVGEKGWKALIPGWNLWIYADICSDGNKVWKLLTVISAGVFHLSFIINFIPLLNLISVFTTIIGGTAMFVAMGAMANLLAKKYGKGMGYRVLVTIFSVLYLPNVPLFILILNKNNEFVEFEAVEEVREAEAAEVVEEVKEAVEAVEAVSLEKNDAEEA